MGGVLGFSPKTMRRSYADGWREERVNILRRWLGGLRVGGGEGVDVKFLGGFVSGLDQGWQLLGPGWWQWGRRVADTFISLYWNPDCCFTFSVNFALSPQFCSVTYDTLFLLFWSLIKRERVTVILNWILDIAFLRDLWLLVTSAPGLVSLPGGCPLRTFGVSSLS